MVTCGKESNNSEDVSNTKVITYQNGSMREFSRFVKIKSEFFLDGLNFLSSEVNRKLIIDKNDVIVMSWTETKTVVWRLPRFGCNGAIGDVEYYLEGAPHAGDVMLKC